MLIDAIKETIALRTSAFDTPPPEVIFTDQTKMFNGRFANYSDNELNIYVENAGKTVKSISGKSTCDDIESGYEIRLNSEKSFSGALLSRNLGLYFEISKC